MEHEISPPVGDRDRPLSSIHAYVTAWVAAGVGVGLTVWWVTGGVTTASLWTALVLLGLTAVAEAVSLNLRSGGSGVTLSLLETAVVIDLLLLGSTQALLVVVGGITLQHVLVRRLPALKLAFNVGQHAVGVGLAVLIVAVAPSGPEVGIERVVAVSVGVLVSRMVSTVALAGVFARLGAPELSDHLTQRWLTLGATTLGNVSLGVIAVVIWMSSPEVAWVVAGPALALHLAYSAGYRIEDLLTDVRVQRDRLERVVDGVREGIVLLDADGRILIWNRAMTTFLGVTETDAVGRSAADLLRGLDEHGFEIDPRALLRGAGEEARVVVAEVEADDGERVPLRLAHTLLWDDGRCTGDVLVVYDLRREREADSLKEDFVARVSHELRTPLSPLRGYAQALRKAGDRVPLTKRNEILDVMVERVGHLERLVNDLLLVSQIGSGGVDLAREIQLEAVDLDELLPRLVSWLGLEQTRNHAIEIVGDGAGRRPAGAHRMKTRAFATATLAAMAAALAIPASAQQRVDDASLTAAASIRAPDAWAAGHTGDGVGIALVDTGVSPRPDLHDGVTGQVVVGARERLTDGHGHGTFLAGLMVGDDGPAGPLGVAPDGHVVSFKAADARGETTLERVVATLGTVRLMADELGLRVVVLALGGPADDVPDPVEEALERLWADGLVVVVASGNDGNVVTEPGVSPYLLTAGATNDHGTADRTDDVVPAWSGRGQGRDGRPKPDVHAPGTSVVSARVPGSLADRENPSSRIGGRWFRGSGTSMAAAVTAGAAALVLDADPDATPDEVKGRLVDSARPTQANPAGTIDVPAALSSTAVANGHLPPIEPSDELAVPDQSSSLPISAQFGWNGSSWIGSSWIGSSWIGSSWIELEWDGSSWIGSSWIDQEWEGSSWIGSSWIGSSWIDQEWEGSSWIGSSWIGSSWIDSSWVDDNWVGVSWTSADDETAR